MLRSARLIISEKVRHALATNKGVVALESTVITHGLPYPQNLETAKALENVIEKENCVPATIALLDGKIHVGLTPGQLQEVADTMDSVKVSRRDIAYALNQKIVGGTTVAATMYLAHMAGIRVFATGGIGGVHRGAEQTFDVSADLVELSTTPVTVVSAGVKSILDIPRTLEFLETSSVNTIVFGKENEFPSFFTRRSGCRGQFNCTDLHEIADIIQTSRELGLMAGTLVACPIPEEYEADGKLIEDAIQEALKMAKEKNIKAQQVTPFILKTVNELTKGASMKTNIALLKNNAKIGAQLSKILVDDNYKSPVQATRPNVPAPKKKPKVTVIGATIVDLETITQKNVEKDGGSYEGHILQRCGGVGRNHADALTRLGVDATLISAVGRDSHGRYVFDNYNHMDTSRISQIDNIPTATYCSINVKGEILYGISAIGKIVDEITPRMIEKNQDAIRDSKFLVLDGNIPVESIAKAVDLAKKYDVPVWFDPTDYHKACKFIDSGRMESVRFISPNVNEFKRIADRIGVILPEEVLQSPEELDRFLRKNTKIMEQFNVLLISMAQEGTLVYRRDTTSTSSASATFLPPPIDPSRIVSASGAGDCLNSGIIAGILRGLPWKESLDIGLKAARCSLESTEAVPESLNNL